MIDALEAARIAEANAPGGHIVAVREVRETRQGWYFPWQFDGEPLIGSKGIIVEKLSGRVFRLGSAFSLERDLAAFDAGTQQPRTQQSRAHARHSFIDHLK